MNLFQVLDVTLCTDPLVTAVIDAVKTVFTLIQIAIPIALIVLCTIDMFKALTSGDEKKTKEVQKTCIRRLIYAVVAFLLPYLISLVFSFAGTLIKGGAEDVNKFQEFFACWSDNDYSNNDDDENNDAVCCKIGQGQYEFVSECSTTTVADSFCE